MVIYRDYLSTNFNRQVQTVHASDPRPQSAVYLRERIIGRLSAYNKALSLSFYNSSLPSMDICDEVALVCVLKNLPPGSNAYLYSSRGNNIVGPYDSFGFMEAGGALPSGAVLLPDLSRAVKLVDAQAMFSKFKASLSNPTPTSPQTVSGPLGTIGGGRRPWGATPFMDPYGMG